MLSSLYNRSVGAFGNAVLLRGVRDCGLVLNAMGLEEALKSIGGVLSSVVTAKHLDLPRLVFYQRLEFSEFREDFILGLEKIYEGLPSLVVYECYEVSCSSERCVIHRTTDI